ncbi:unnamed protein product [Gongylonema pulchrum]|uniref:GE37468 family thiazolyl peptide n=1 Tax=Gongylonema pulchrum TaxID=637853 RepID=A0A183EYZ5_9BILA|nr:unnamed protein product [Gongylonema pulchrum]
MNKSTGVDYLEPYEIGELVDGLEGIGVVEMISPEYVPFEMQYTCGSVAFPFFLHLNCG